jgi:hypothetical protein
MKKDKGGSQLEAVSHIKRFLAQKGLNLPSRCIEVGNDAGWLVFERGGRGIGKPGLAKDSLDANCQSVEKPCTVRGY